MQTCNWNYFVKRITIHAGISSVISAWTSQQGLEKWFLRSAEFTTADGHIRNIIETIQKGDHYKWLWFGYDDMAAEEGDILSVNAGSVLEFTFSGGCIVNLILNREEGETVCELQQTMPMDTENEKRHFFIECGTGWSFYLTNLKSVLEGGIDLRNRNAQVQSVINT